MKKSLTIFALACILIGMMATSCTHDEKKSSKVSADSISFTSLKMGDTTSFTKSDGEICKELVDVSATYPAFFKDKTTTQKLQKLYITAILNGNDSLRIADAIKEFTLNLSQQNALGNNGSDVDGENEENYENEIDKFVITVNITVAYHQNNVVTFCKEETIRKNDVAAKNHKYYNFDLETMKLIDLSMFRDDAINDICSLLKNKLMEQNQVNTGDELNDLGYFNIDNLSVTTNFSFEEDGITWSYLPQELAADANLEPKISLSYRNLMQFASEKSVLKRF